MYNSVRREVREALTKRDGGGMVPTGKVAIFGDFSENSVKIYTLNGRCVPSPQLYTPLFSITVSCVLKKK